MPNFTPVITIYEQISERNIERKISKQMPTDHIKNTTIIKTKMEVFMMRNAFSELPPVLNVKDLHAFLGIPQSSIYDLLHRADFPTLHVNSRLLVLKADLLEWMKQHINENSIILTNPAFYDGNEETPQGRAR